MSTEQLLEPDEWDEENLKKTGKHFERKITYFKCERAEDKMYTKQLIKPGYEWDENAKMLFCQYLRVCFNRDNCELIRRRFRGTEVRQNLIQNELKYKIFSYLQRFRKENDGLVMVIPVIMEEQLPIDEVSPPEERLMDVVEDPPSQETQLSLMEDHMMAVVEEPPQINVEIPSIVVEECMIAVVVEPSPINEGTPPVFVKEPLINEPPVINEPPPINEDEPAVIRQRITKRRLAISK